MLSNLHRNFIKLKSLKTFGCPKIYWAWFPNLDPNFKRNFYGQAYIIIMKTFQNLHWIQTLTSLKKTSNVDYRRLSEGNSAEKP